MRDKVAQGIRNKRYLVYISDNLIIYVSGIYRIYHLLYAGNNLSMVVWSKYNLIILSILSDFNVIKY